jgi:threonine synthase
VTVPAGEAASEASRWARALRCTRTGEALPLDEPAFLSSAGAPLVVEYALEGRSGEALVRSLSGRPWTLWRYGELLPVADPARRVSLGEGGTPLVPLRRIAPPGVEVLLKQEAANPTGSFKDRGLSVAVSRALELGAPGVELPSAGNAAISIAAYASAAGLPCRVALPAETPRAVARLCAAYGAEVLSGGTTLVEAGRRLAAEPRGFWSLATLKEPYRAEGKKTMGLELAEQLGWRLPDWILYPTGGGTGIVGMHKAFGELERLGLVSGRRPRFVVVQTRGCAPIVRAWERGLESAEEWESPRSRVWGLRVPRAIGDFLVLRALRETDGVAVAVDEAAIGPACARLARREGLLAGPEGGAALVALDDLCSRGAIAEGESVVVFQTGHPANYADG